MDLDQIHGEFDAVALPILRGVREKASRGAKSLIEMRTPERAVLAADDVLALAKRFADQRFGDDDRARDFINEAAMRMSNHPDAHPTTASTLRSWLMSNDMAFTKM